MKICFKPKRFSAETKELIATLDAIISEYQEKGYRLSLRQLYYQCVKANIIPNTVQEYKRLGGIVSDARLSGDLDIGVIEDRGRETSFPQVWDSPAQVIMSAAYSFHLDLWATQPNYVEVMVEKDALSGILEPVCMQERVPFMANKGYISTSFGYAIGTRLERVYKGDSDTPGKDIHIIYLGDHDPSGTQMTQDVEDRLRMFAHGIPITVHRVALNMDQIELYAPPENPAKEEDSRYASYVETYGTTSSWELDALSPEVLASLVQRKVRSLRDDDAWEIMLKEEERQQRLLKSMASKFSERFSK